MAEQLRNEADPSRIESEVLQVIDATLRPSDARIWLSGNERVAEG